MGRSVSSMLRWCKPWSAPSDGSVHFRRQTLLVQLEDDSLRIWKKGDAAFMRNWPYAYVESMRPDSGVRNQVGVTLLPKGDHAGARHADVLGGFQLMVNKKSANKNAAIELVKFLTSPEIQHVNAATRGYAPTRPALYDSPALKANPFLATLRNVLLNAAVIRPSTAAGPKYDRLSRSYFTVVRQTLTGEKSADAAVTELESELHRVTAKLQQGSLPLVGDGKHRVRPYSQ